MAKRPANVPGEAKPPATSSTGSKTVFDPFQPPPITQRRWQATPELAQEMHRLGRKARALKWASVWVQVASGLLMGIIYYWMFSNVETHSNTFLRLPAGRNLGIEPSDMLWVMQNGYLTAAIVGGVIIGLGFLMLKLPITGGAIALLAFLVPHVFMVANVGPNILAYQWVWPVCVLIGLISALMIGHSAKAEAMK